MRNRRACGYVVALVALAAAWRPTPAPANDRDLRATVVHAYSCAKQLDGFDEPRWGAGGIAALPGRSAEEPESRALLYCPLPLNNIDLGGTTNDNDMSAFTVLYMDADGLGDAVSIWVTLYRSTLDSRGNLAQFSVCEWQSNHDGVPGSGYRFVRARVPCALDLSAVDTYHFEVFLQSSLVANALVTAGFGGIRFP